MGLREANYALSILCIIICSILLIYQLLNFKRSRTEKWFSVLIIGNIGMLVGDMIQMIYDGVPGMATIVMETIFNIIIYNMCSAILLLGMCGWITSYVAQRVKVSGWIMKAAMLLAGIHIIYSCFIPVIKSCYIDENYYYQRSSYFMVNVIIPYIIYLITIIFAFRHYKSFKKIEFTVLGSFIIIPLCAQIIQVFYGKYLITNVATTVGIIAAITFIQNQRERDKEQRIRELVNTENKKLEDIRKRQENLNNQLIEVLCRTVEAKDIYTRGHSMRVAQYAREIMYRLGGDEVAQQEVYCIGILHDVGKIRVNDAIINKKGRLDNEEYEQIKLHTIAGFQILRDVDIIPDLAIGARWHHERYDGTGYPNGLAGENIPLIARIISVADAYDAMTSNRSYHSVMPQKDVREQIVKGMGTQFDPKIAQIMLDMIDEDVDYDMKQVNYNNVVNILMIDDDQFMHTMVDSILGAENYVISFANSGQEGIDLLKENKYDLVLLDMEMPGMNGFEVLNWIHSNIRKQRVIFLTGDKDIETIKKSEALGAMDYLTKPIKGNVLKESISSVLKR